MDHPLCLMREMHHIGEGRHWDLLVRVNVSSSMYSRQGVNLHHDAKNTLAYSDSGGRVACQRLMDMWTVRVPGGTQQGEEMVLKGRGVQPGFVVRKGILSCLS